MATYGSFIKIMACIGTLFTGIVIHKMYLQKNASAPGMVIVLNGPSASGKTSIQKAFQDMMLPALWIKLGVDTLFDAPMPNITLENMAYWQTKNDIRYVTSTADEQKNPVITLHVGKSGQQVVAGMNSAIVAYAKAGCNVIVDYIAYEQSWIDDLKAQLSDSAIPSYFVKVDIPLEVLEARERARGTSPVGHARSHYATVYGDIAYDLVVYPEKNSPQEIAQQIKQHCI